MGLQLWQSGALEGRLQCRSTIKQHLDLGAGFRPKAAHCLLSEKQALSLEQAVQQITYNTATLWGLHDRGLLREGMAADVVVFDAETIGARMPEVVHDLPAGAQRLKQTADGILNTVVNGEILLSNNEHSGATPGQLLRS